MSDLSRWQFLEFFTAFEASALICGISPEDAIVLDFNFQERISGDLVPVHRRIDASYSSAKLELSYTTNASPEYLQSTLLCLNRSAAIAGSVPLNECQAMMAHPSTDLKKQQFSRNEIARWLKHHNFNSSFKFDVDGPDAPRASPVQSRPEKWPWGSHETQLLDHLRAAAQRWWVNYNPAEIDTAPVNDAVIDWLVTERKISKSMATSMATILRADGLRTGPRQ